jgi:transposase
MKNLTIGIDVSKDKLDYCIVENQNRHVIQRGVIENSKQAIQKWIKTLEAERLNFALEHTGHYGVLFTWLLSENGFTFYLINPYEIKTSLGVQRGKTDAVDAYRIACYSIGNSYKLTPYKLPTKELQQLKAMLTARARYVKIRTQLKNSLKANEILNKTLDVKILIRQEKKQIKQITKTIELLEKQMLELIKQKEELKNSYQKVSRVIGVGPITAIQCIVETNNFLKYSNARKFSCHCGLAPFPYQSGSSITGKSRTHFLHKKPMKAILFKAASSAIQHDPQLKMYYNKKIKEGKHKLSVINAVANKLVLRIFAVAKRDEPFVKLAA